jgi:transposase
MRYIAGEARGQATLFPQTLEEYISEENPVRFIDAFVSSLDLVELGFVRAQPAATGRPGYEPGDMLRLYQYGYLNRLRSSRRLETEAARNVELMWLLRKLKPDFKTIADFRAQNAEPLTKVCKQFVVLCRGLDLFGGELVAVDGSKFRASNSRNRIFTAKQLRKELERIEQKIREYMVQLDENDRREQAAPAKPRLSAEQLNEKIDKMKERQQRYQELQKKLEEQKVSDNQNSSDQPKADEQNADEQNAKQLALTDADARLMHRSGGGGTVVAYNVQSVVDAKYKLIVVHDVTNDTSDQHQLARMTVAAKQALGVQRLEVVADQGYYDADQVAACEQAGIAAYVSKPNTSKNVKRGLFTKQDFVYQPQTDRYRCPGAQWLESRGTMTDKGRKLKYYLTEACGSCTLRKRCTEAQGPRRIKRLVNEEVIERMAARVAAQPDKLKQRKALVEHPFGTLKRALNHGYFLLRSLPKVKGEFSLSVFTYNLKRVLNILGTERMVAALALG